MIKKTKMLISHYRKLGVEKIAVLDNGSDDGTFSWLKAQNSVDLFFSLQKYQGNIKDGWINLLEPAECYLGILHFKFMAEDVVSFLNKSTSYKMYVDFIIKHKNASFMYEGSREFVDSQSLRNINLIKEMEL